MALRVLLADESSTIKKVIQLALQDYAVEVKSVQVGTEFFDVCQDFAPDIVFADILLQKKNGYEICAEIKQNPELRSTPVVLMWSGFMELDQDKFQACSADAQLEKPFDILTLRNLVQNLVAKTKTQTLSEFLDLPEAPQQEPVPSMQQQPPIENESSNSESFFVETEEFESVQLPPVQNITTSSSPTQQPHPHDFIDEFETPSHSEENDDDNEWQQKSLDDFKIDPMTLDKEPQVELKSEPEATSSLNHLNPSPEDFIDSSFEDDKTPAPPTAQESIQPAQDTFSPEELLHTPQVQDMIKKEAQVMAEKIAWQVIPDLATQIIERELKRLLKDPGSTRPTP